VLGIIVAVLTTWDVKIVVETALFLFLNFYGLPVVIAYYFYNPRPFWIYALYVVFWYIDYKAWQLEAREEAMKEIEKELEKQNAVQEGLRKLIEGMFK